MGLLGNKGLEVRREPQELVGLKVLRDKQDLLVPQALLVPWGLLGLMVHWVIQVPREILERLV